MESGAALASIDQGKAGENKEDDSQVSREKQRVQVGVVQTPPEDWHKVPAGKSWHLVAQFPQTYTSVPTVIPIWQAFDISNSSYSNTFRLGTELVSTGTDRAVILVNTWADCTLYAAGVAWMAIPSSLRVLQTDVAYVPAEGLRTRIHFPRRFNVQPQVFCTMTELDVANNWRLEINTHSITSEGFDITANASGSSILHSAKVRWLAWPGDQPQVGVYTVFLNEQQKGQSGYIEFDRYFTETPQVFIGLSRIDISSSHNGRLTLGVSNVTTNGFEYNVGTWGDTLLYIVRVDFLVLGPLDNF
ncbi:hypothetical protein V8C37DRAFT_403314 [Trichoderma ceciliae]